MKSITTFFFLFYAFVGWSQIPDLQLKDLDQNQNSLEALKGEKYTVVDFWATWCKPCVAAIPKLNEIYAEFSDKGVNLIGVNVDGPRNQAKVKPLVRSLNVNYPILLDPDQELVNDLNVSAFPTLLVFNSKGKEVFVHEGFTAGDEDIIRKKLTELLK